MARANNFDALRLLAAATVAGRWCAVVGLPSVGLVAATELGLETASEVFADRNYLPNGSLVPRSDSKAFVHDPIEAADRIVRMLLEGKVRAVDGTDVPVLVGTVCVHGDNPQAVIFARELRKRLELEKVMIAAPAPPP